MIFNFVILANILHGILPRLLQPMKARTRSELSSLYGIDPKTFRKWLKNMGLGEEHGILSPAIQLRIFEKYGLPDGMEIRDDRLQPNKKGA